MNWVSVITFLFIFYSKANLIERNEQSNNYVIENHRLDILSSLKLTDNSGSSLTDGSSSLENSSSSSNNEDPFDLNLPNDELWQNFCEIFNRSYSSEEEIRYRKNVFIEQIELYRFFNSQRKNESFALFGVTLLSDKNLTEIACTNPKSLLNSTLKTPSPPPLLPQITNPPLNFSRCGKYVENNGENISKEDYCADIFWEGCDGCYAFSATEMAHIVFFNQTGFKSKVKPQTYFDCSIGAKGCCGGDTSKILKSFPFVLFDEDGTIENKTNLTQYLTCNHGNCELKPPSGLLKNIIEFGSIHSAKDFKSLLLVYGPFVSSIKLINGIQGYLGGIIDLDECKNESIIASHSIIVVGYGNENGTDYLIAKNWWNNWGDDESGYMKILMDSPCGIGSQPEGKESTNYIIQFYYCIGDPYCIECDEETGKCLECSYLSRLDKNGMCTRECPEDCLTCDKELEECFSCKNNAVLSEDGKCVIVCPPNCKTCERESLNCTSCHPSFILKHSKCIFSCTDDCEICDSINEVCTKCKDKAELINGYCAVSCPEGCKTCDRETQRCFSCKRFYRMNETVCVPTCKDKCIDCDETNTNCILCEAGYALLEGSCYSPKCKKNCKYCNITNPYCVECFDPYFVFKGDCRINSKSSLVLLFVFIVISLMITALL